jgi:diacylglycerol O-acyltransferase
VLPLREPRALAIGVTSYDGSVFYGINADRDAVADVDVLASCLADALEELVETTRPDRPRAPRGTGPARAAGTVQASPRAPRRTPRRPPGARA